MLLLTVILAYSLYSAACTWNCTSAWKIFDHTLFRYFCNNSCGRFATSLNWISCIYRTRFDKRLCRKRKTQVSEDCRIWREISWCIFLTWRSTGFQWSTWRNSWRIYLQNLWQKYFHFNQWSKIRGVPKAMPHAHMLHHYTMPWRCISLGQISRQWNGRIHYRNIQLTYS